MLDKRKRKNNKGFTLVELLVVMSIMGILAILAIPSLLKNINKAKATQVVTNINAIEKVVVSQYTSGEIISNIEKNTVESLVTDLKVADAETYEFDRATTNEVDIKVTTSNKVILDYIKSTFGAKATMDTDSTPGYIIVKVLNE